MRADALEKQPKWVQTHIEVLEMRIRVKDARIAKLEHNLDPGADSNIRIKRYESADTLLDSYEKVSFFFNDGEDRFDIGLVKGGVEVYHYGGFGTFTVRPRTANHLYLEVHGDR